MGSLLFKKKSNMAKVTKPTKAVKVAKVAKKAVAPVVEKAKVAHTDGLSASVFGLDGKVKSHMTLPSEVFAEGPNKQLLAQAIRVYLANQREGSASTKTRGEVEGSTRKIYRQKGSGKARHGSIRAHIFVGGGIVFGPVPHSFSMDFPVKMKRKALAVALTTQLQAGNVLVVDGLETVNKTKIMAEALSAIGTKKNVLVVLAKESKDAARAARNIEGVSIVPATSLNTYSVMAAQKVVFMKDAVGQVKEVITKA
jgi:large subunit ribosomal protein L4